MSALSEWEKAQEEENGMLLEKRILPDGRTKYIYSNGHIAFIDTMDYHDDQNVSERQVPEIMEFEHKSFDTDLITDKESPELDSYDEEPRRLVALQMATEIDVYETFEELITQTAVINKWLATGDLPADLDPFAPLEKANPSLVSAQGGAGGPGSDEPSPEPTPEVSGLQEGAGEADPES